MVSVSTQLDRLGLSAHELKELSGWPDALIEDYLNILRGLLQLSEFIDEDITNIEELEIEVAAIQVSLMSAFQQIADLHSQLGLSRAKVVKLQAQASNLAQVNSEQDAMIGSLRSQTAKNKARIEDAVQEIYA